VNDDIALTVAQRLIKAEEGCYLVAYPDPASPLAKALGPKAAEQIGRGAGVPEHLRHLSGDPWTIGYGQTGADVKRGTVWSQQQADSRLAQTLSLTFAAVKVAWPGSHRLHPKAQAALISLAYNRGTSLTKKAGDALDRRREMRELQPLVVRKDYAGMARAFLSMRRIWEGKGLAGLLRRREAEAALCEEALTEVGRA
jgi:lysozyme